MKIISINEITDIFTPLLDEGINSEKEGKIIRAIYFLERSVTEEHPIAASHARIELADLYFVNGNYRRSSLWIMDFYRSDSGLLMEEAYEHIKIIEGHVNMKTGKYDRAANLFTEALKILPVDSTVIPQILSLRGEANSFYGTEKIMSLLDAEWDLRTAIDMGYDTPYTNTILGEVLIKLNNFYGGEEFLEKAKTSLNSKEEIAHEDTMLLIRIEEALINVHNKKNIYIQELITSM